MTSVEAKVPSYTLESLVRYMNKGVPTGDFLKSVLCNKLVESYSHADCENTAAMQYIVMYVYNYLPYDCWGSEERYLNWIEAGGIEGYLSKGVNT